MNSFERYLDTFPIRTMAVPAVLNVDQRTEWIYNALESRNDPDIICTRTWLDDPDYLVSVNYPVHTQSSESIITAEVLNNPDKGTEVTVVSYPINQNHQKENTPDTRSSFIVQYDGDGNMNRATVYGRYMNKQITANIFIHSADIQFIQGWEYAVLDNSNASMNAKPYVDLSAERKSSLNLVLRGNTFFVEMHSDHIRILNGTNYLRAPISIGAIRDILIAKTPKHLNSFPAHLFKAEKIK